MNELKELLNSLPPGKIGNIADVERLLAASWDLFAGSGDGGMVGAKLLGRMESVDWQPPILSFVIERHGGTVCGSTRAELQHWQVNVDAMTAEITGTGRRQLEPMAERVDVGPIKDEIVQKILAGEDDPRLRWIEPGVVQIVLARIFPNGSGYKQTVEGRRKRLRDALADHLTIEGWMYHGRNVFQRQSAEDQEQLGHIFLIDLADELGLDRSFLHRKAKRERVKIVKVPRMTDGGAVACSAVPTIWANKVSAFYMAARANEHQIIPQVEDHRWQQGSSTNRESPLEKIKNKAPRR